MSDDTDDVPMKKVRLKEGYGLPFFADGTIRNTIETIDGEAVMHLAVTARGETVEEQTEHFNAERLRFARYCDLINLGIDAEMGG